MKKIIFIACLIGFYSESYSDVPYKYQYHEIIRDYDDSVKVTVMEMERLEKRLVNIEKILKDIQGVINVRADDNGTFADIYALDYAVCNKKISQGKDDGSCLDILNECVKLSSPNNYFLLSKCMDLNAKQ